MQHIYDSYTNLQDPDREKPDPDPRGPLLGLALIALSGGAVAWGIKSILGWWRG